MFSSGLLVGVESKASFLRGGPLVVIGDGGSQSLGECFASGRCMIPSIEGLADDANRQADARLFGRVAELNLLFDGEELNDRQSQKRPVQLDQRPIRPSRAKLASAEGLLSARNCSSTPQRRWYSRTASRSESSWDSRTLVTTYASPRPNRNRINRNTNGGSFLRAAAEGQQYTIPARSRA